MVKFDPYTRAKTCQKPEDIKDLLATYNLHEGMQFLELHQQQP